VQVLTQHREVRAIVPTPAEVKGHRQDVGLAMRPRILQCRGKKVTGVNPAAAEHRHASETVALAFECPLKLRAQRAGELA
jgi:hypothetical protein